MRCLPHTLVFSVHLNRLTSDCFRTLSMIIISLAVVIILLAIEITAEAPIADRKIALFLHTTLGAHTEIRRNPEEWEMFHRKTFLCKCVCANASQRANKKTVNVFLRNYVRCHIKSHLIEWKLKKNMQKQKWYRGWNEERCPIQKKVIFLQLETGNELSESSWTGCSHVSSVNENKCAAAFSLNAIFKRVFGVNYYYYYCVLNTNAYACSLFSYARARSAVQLHECQV